MIRWSRVRSKKTYVMLWVVSWVGLLDNLVGILSFGTVHSHIKGHLLFRKGWSKRLKRFEHQENTHGCS